MKGGIVHAVRNRICSADEGANPQQEDTMLSQFQDIYRSVTAGEPAALRFQADGQTYTRSFLPPERLLILGGGHIVRPLCRFASELDFDVTVTDDRPEFANHERFPEAAAVLCDSFPNAIRHFSVSRGDYVAIVTRGHRYDADCLRTILPGVFPKYLGMIGSRRRVGELRKLLEEEGFSRDLLEQLHAPIGVEIGALTVKEIAISIVAELIQARRAGASESAEETKLAAEEIDLPLIQTLALDPTPKALMIVYETGGSTPVKSGAMMAIDKNNRSYGTIGGGCSENAVRLAAYRMIGTGQRRSVRIDLSNDVAEDAGMVCGGWMKVLIQDVRNTEPEKPTSES